MLVLVFSPSSSTLSFIFSSSFLTQMSLFLCLLTHFYTLLFLHWSTFPQVIYIVYFSYVFEFLSMFFVVFLAFKIFLCQAPGLHLWLSCLLLCGLQCLACAPSLVIPGLYFSVSMLHLNISRLLLLYQNCIYRHCMINILLYTDNVVTIRSSNTYYHLHKKLHCLMQRQSKPK